MEKLYNHSFGDTRRKFRAYAINTGSQVVGWSNVGDNNDHACIWKNGEITDLQTFGGKISLGCIEGCLGKNRP
ncbi:MAG TPA: hypothetical protein VF941_14925 [Clostridia bacterium]